MTRLSASDAIGSWRDLRVAVTGAGGFVGSHLATRLVEEGARVKALVHYNSRNDWGHLRSLPTQVVGKLEVLAGDIREPRAVRELVDGAEVVFHLAALIGIPYSYTSPTDVVQTNVLGTLNVLEAVRDARTPRVVITSTSEVYGTAIYGPIDEVHPLQGQSPYSASKIGSDKLGECYYRSFGVPVVTVRPFNTFGPRQSTRAVIPTIITQALTCDRIRLGSLEPKRDFTFVRDTVDGFVRCAATPACVGEVVNLGTGVEVSVGRVVELVQSILGRSLPVEQDDVRLRPAKSEVMRLLCNHEKASRLTGWEPKHTLESGLTETIEWISKHLDQYQSRAYAI